MSQLVSTLMGRGIEFVKGHGTENDFVLLPDVAGALDLTGSRVRAVCDRHRGLGADGVLRVAPTVAVPDAPPDTVDTAWFMDYHNADGSAARMCGNGARVFARYLVQAGLADGAEVRFGTRAGARTVLLHPDGSATVEMGRATVRGRATATIDGAVFEGSIVDVGNPHLVCRTETCLDALDLSIPPRFDTATFPHGVNVELVDTDAAGQPRVRIHERGVGETRSCGTGAVAVAAAALRTRDGTVTVTLPGGRVRVTVRAGEASLTGPAVLVASGCLDQDWWLSI